MKNIEFFEVSSVAAANEVLQTWQNNKISPYSSLELLDANYARFNSEYALAVDLLNSKSAIIDAMLNLSDLPSLLDAFMSLKSSSASLKNFINSVIANVDTMNKVLKTTATNLDIFTAGKNATQINTEILNKISLKTGINSAELLNHRSEVASEVQAGSLKTIAQQVSEFSPAIAKVDSAVKASALIARDYNKALADKINAKSDLDWDESAANIAASEEANAKFQAAKDLLLGDQSSFASQIEQLENEAAQVATDINAGKDPAASAAGDDAASGDSAAGDESADTAGDDSAASDDTAGDAAGDTTDKPNADKEDKIPSVFDSATPIAARKLITPDANENIYSLGNGQYYYAAKAIEGVSLEKSLNELAALGVNKILDMKLGLWAIGTDGRFYTDNEVIVSENEMGVFGDEHTGKVTDKTPNELIEIITNGTFNAFVDTFGDIKSAARWKDYKNNWDLYSKVKSVYDESNAALAGQYGDIIGGFHVAEDTPAHVVIFDNPHQASLLNKYMIENSFTYTYKTSSGYTHTVTVTKNPLENNLKINYDKYNFTYEGPLKPIAKITYSGQFNGDGSGIYWLNDEYIDKSENYTVDLFAKSGSFKQPSEGDNLYNVNGLFYYYAKEEIADAMNKSLAELKAAGAHQIILTNQELSLYNIDFSDDTIDGKALSTKAMNLPVKHIESNYQLTEEVYKLPYADGSEGIFSLGDNKYYYASEAIEGVDFNLSLAELNAMGVHKLIDLSKTDMAAGTDGKLYSKYSAYQPSNPMATAKTAQEVMDMLDHGTYADYVAYMGDTEYRFTRSFKLNADDINNLASWEKSKHTYKLKDADGNYQIPFTSIAGEYDLIVGKGLQIDSQMPWYLKFYDQDSAKLLKQYILDTTLATNYHKAIISTNEDTGLALDLDGTKLNVDGDILSLLNKFLINREYGLDFRHNGKEYKLSQVKDVHLSSVHTEPALKGLDLPGKGESIFYYKGVMGEYSKTDRLALYGERAPKVPDINQVTLKDLAKFGIHKFSYIRWGNTTEEVKVDLVNKVYYTDPKYKFTLTAADFSIKIGDITYNKQFQTHGRDDYIKDSELASADAIAAADAIDTDASDTSDTIATTDVAAKIANDTAAKIADANADTIDAAANASATAAYLSALKAQPASEYASEQFTSEQINDAEQISLLALNNTPTDLAF